jgi:hypothetical protein
VNVLPEVHYGDREELGPLKPPVGVAVDPVVLRGSRPPPWSIVVHDVVHDDDLALHQPNRTSTRRRVLPTPHQFTFQPERLGRVPHAGPPTYQDHEDQCQLTFLLLPFLPTTLSLLTALTSFSLANSISLSAPFQEDDVEKLLTIPDFPVLPP